MGVNMTGISLFCLGYTAWSWAIEIMLNVQTHTYPHIQEMVNQNERYLWNLWSKYNFFYFEE